MKKIFTLISFLVLIGSASKTQPIKWTKKAPGYSLVPQKGINEMIAVDKDIAWALAYERNNAFVNPMTDFIRTTDGGKHWIPGTVKGYSDQFLVGLAPLSSVTAYVLSSDINFAGKVLKTIDGGLTWIQLKVAPYPAFYENIHFFNEREGVITADTVLTSEDHFLAIYVTNDGGKTWKRVPQKNLPKDAANEGSYIFSMSAIGDAMWTVSSKARVWKTMDKGLHWAAYATPETEAFVSNIKMRDGLHGLWGINDELYRTADGGKTWTDVHPKGIFFTFDLAYVPGTAGTYVSSGGDTSQNDFFPGALHGLGSSFSNDDGDTWVTIDTAVDHLAIDMVNTTTGFCGGFNTNTGNGVFKLSGEIPCRDIKSSIIEDHFTIQTFSPKVYPNPFSNSTTISFTLLQQPKTIAAGSQVSIRIYDMKGRLVRVLADAQMQPGTHQLTWDAKDEKGNTVNAGIYFLRFTAGDYAETKKLSVIN